MFCERHRQSRAQMLEVLKEASSRLNPMRTDLIQCLHGLGRNGYGLNMLKLI